MSRLELIAILVIIVAYLWWRVRRRVEAMKAAFRGEPKQAQQPERQAASQITLEKDPETGVYRPPKG